MSRIPSIRRSYVVSQIGLIVVLLMAKTHNPSIRLCCDLFQMETRAVLMVLPDTISSELKIILEKIPFQVLSRSTAGVKVSSRSIITPIVSWLPGRQEGRHEGVNCMTKHWQGHLPTHPTICTSCTEGCPHKIPVYVLLVLYTMHSSCYSPSAKSWSATTYNMQHGGEISPGQLS